MNPTIYFRKEENGNVTIKNDVNDKIIASLQPAQNIIVSASNSSIFEIKNSTANPSEKGIVINVNDISPYDCTPQIIVIDEHGEAYTGEKLRDVIIVALTTSFFFELSGGLQNISFNRILRPQGFETGHIFFNRIALSDTLADAVPAGDYAGVFNSPDFAQSNVLFYASKKTKLISYTGAVRKIGFRLQIYKAAISIDSFNFDGIQLLASIPLNNYQDTIDLRQYIHTDINPNEVVIVSYKSPSGSLESYFWFNGTFAVQ